MREVPLYTLNPQPQTPNANRVSCRAAARAGSGAGAVQKAAGGEPTLLPLLEFCLGRTGSNEQGGTPAPPRA